MTEKNIWYSMLIKELTDLKGEKRKTKAQEILIKGCLSVNKTLIDIALSFGGNMTLFKNGECPLQILERIERENRKNLVENK